MSAPAYTDPLPLSRYTIAVGPPLAPADYELTEWGALSLTLPVGGPASVTFGPIPGPHPDAARIVELETDLWVIRDEVPLFRGRIISGDDTADETTSAVSFSATDYRGVLGRRILRAPQSFTQVEQAEIALALIDHAQAAPGGSYGIAAGAAWPTGRLRDRFYEDGGNIGALITDLSNVIDGFDWTIDPDLHLQVWSPRRVRYPSTVLDLGGNLARVSRTRRTDTYASAVRVNGSAETTPVYLAAAPGVAGVWEAQYGYQDVTEQMTVQAKAEFCLAESQDLRPVFVAALTPWRWGEDADLLPGDIVPLIARTGRLDVAAMVRCTELRVTLDGATGTETVEAALVAEPA